VNAETNEKQWVMSKQIKPYKEVLERLKAVRDIGNYADVVHSAYGKWPAENEARFVAGSWHSIPDSFLYAA
jgi:hypothetical protein